MTTKQKVIMYIFIAIISFCMGYKFGDVTGFVKGTNKADLYYDKIIQETQAVPL